MAKEIVFELDDDLTPLQGVAVVFCAREDGDTAIQLIGYGDPHVYQAIGLLTGALDDARAQFAEDFEERDGYGGSGYVEEPDEEDE